MRALVVAIIFVLAAADAALAHGDAPHDGSLSWTFDSWIVVPLLAAAAIYSIGAYALWWRAGFGRLRGWQALAYGLGWLTLAGALVSPLHWLGEHVFAFHMIEHEVVMAVAAPLLVLARPFGVLMWGLPARLRLHLAALIRQQSIRNAWDWFSRGGNATLLHGIVIWAWHAPVLFDAAVAHVAVHRLQHLSFFVSAVVFWWSVLRRSTPGLGAWHLFVTMLHTGALGALMTLAPRVLYETQTRFSAEWGLTPLEDQQLAGLIMWIPAGTVYAGAALVLAAMWIGRSSQDVRPRDAHS